MEPHFDEASAKDAWQQAGRLVEVRARAESPEDFMEYETGALVQAVDSVVGEESIPEELSLRIALHLDALAFWASTLLWGWAEASAAPHQPVEAKIKELIGEAARQMRTLEAGKGEDSNPSTA